MNSKGSAKKLDVQVEALCRLLAQILTRIINEHGVDKETA